MRALLPRDSDATDENADVDVHEHYATDWLDRGGVRANFVSSVDGAVSADGVSKGLQTPGDNRVFAALRDLADVVLVGSGTARAESYGATSPSEQRRATRQRFGLAETLPVAVLSRSLGLDAGSALFTEARPGARTIVLTVSSADDERRRALAEVADVVDCGPDAIDPSSVRRALADRGLTRVVFEGGPTVFADFARAGEVDELCLSVSPALAGPGPGRITAGDGWNSPRPLSLVGLLEDDGALFCRYRVGR